jgi:hypothetical protein
MFTCLPLKSYTYLRVEGVPDTSDSGTGLTWIGGCLSVSDPQRVSEFRDCV